MRSEEWSDLGIDPDALSFRGETLVASTPPAATTLLPALLEQSEGRAQLELGEVLGEGGMGMVRAATQTALHRSVAVKTVRPELAGERQAHQLIREARVTGLLEHPNIVPVHALGAGAEGEPMLVMKHVEGTPWSDLLDGEERRTGSYLRKHLRILQKVATAIDFAHSRKILHRDIKPDNVMIGAFGEVYVMDWGIAVSLDEELTIAPLARDVRNIEGTPVYLAPEMAGGRGSDLGVWSDVYLLGATLHHVLTGRPPHDGPHIHAILAAAFVSVPPKYRPEIPKELIAIAHRALSRDPKERFPHAAAFAHAIDDFLVHRASIELCEEAETRASELARHVAAGEASEEVEVLFHEASFAFGRALREWPENARAAASRRSLLEDMIAFELGRGGTKAATKHLERHDAPSEELVARVRQAAADEDAKRNRLASLERDMDHGFGVKERVWLAYLTAFNWFVLLFGAGALTRFDIWPVTHRRFAIVGAGLLVGCVLSAYLLRAKLLATATNRLVMMTSTLVFGAGIAFWLLLGSLGISMAETTVLGAMTMGALWTTLVFSFGRAWMPMAVGHFIVAALAWAWPTYHFEIFGLIAIPILMTARWMVSEVE